MEVAYFIRYWGKLEIELDLFYFYQLKCCFSNIVVCTGLWLSVFIFLGTVVIIYLLYGISFVFVILMVESCMDV